MEPADTPAAQPTDATAAFAARTPWTAGAATVFAFIVFSIAAAMAVAAGTLYFKLGQWLRSPGDVIAAEHVTMTNTMLATGVLQLVTITLVWWGAARFAGERRAVLSLPDRLPGNAIVIGVAGMVAILAPYNLATYLLWPEDYAADLRPFSDLVRSSAFWLGVLVIAIGAPLWEELLFRGFLLPALSKTRYGFLGASFLTTFAWTIMHMGYTLVSLVEVMLIGLYFCWLMWRFGNLWLTIILHALYNGLQLAILALWPQTLAGG